MISVTPMTKSDALVTHEIRKRVHLATFSWADQSHAVPSVRRV